MLYFVLAGLCSSTTTTQRALTLLFRFKTEKTLLGFLFQAQCFRSTAVWNMCVRVRERKLFLLITFDWRFVNSHLSERKPTETRFLKPQIRFSWLGVYQVERKGNSTVCFMCSCIIRDKEKLCLEVFISLFWLVGTKKFHHFIPAAFISQLQQA